MTSSCIDFVCGYQPVLRSMTEHRLWSGVIHLRFHCNFHLLLVMLHMFIDPYKSSLKWLKPIQIEHYNNGLSWSAYLVPPTPLKCWGLDKMAVICRWHSHMHFHDRKCILFKISLKIGSEGLFESKSSSVLAMKLCLSNAKPDLNQCWPSFMLVKGATGVSMPQWAKRKECAPRWLFAEANLMKNSHYKRCSSQQ